MLLCSLLVFFFWRCSLPFCGAAGCFCLCGALTWCVLLFGVAVSRCVVVLVSAALCCLVLCCAVARLLVMCCVVCFVAVLGSRLASSAAVAGSCALSLGPVLCCPAVLPVVGLLSFLVSLFWAPLVSWCLLCGAVLVCLRRFTLCGALSPLWRVAEVVCCCLLCLGVCCWAWLSSGVSWSVLLAPGVVFRCCCPYLVAWLAALWFGVVCLGAPLPCVVSCGAVLPCGGVLSCSSFFFASLPVPVVCILLTSPQWQTLRCYVTPGICDIHHHDGNAWVLYTGRRVAVTHQKDTQ